MKRLLELIQCIRRLGAITGFRYWRLMKLCRQDPGLVLRIAKRVEYEAESARNRMKTEDDARWYFLWKEKAEVNESFARLLRKCHADYMEANSPDTNNQSSTC